MRQMIRDSAQHPRAIMAIVALLVVTSVPFLVAFLVPPRGLHFTGAPTYAEDVAQHEAWATDMSAHFWYQNLLTPEPIPRGWFVSPQEVAFGLVMKATGLPYMAL